MLHQPKNQTRKAETTQSRKAIFRVSLEYSLHETAVIFNINSHTHTPIFLFLCILQVTESGSHEI